MPHRTPEPVMGQGAVATAVARRRRREASLQQAAGGSLGVLADTLLILFGGEGVHSASSRYPSIVPGRTFTTVRRRRGCSLGVGPIPLTSTEDDFPIKFQFDYRNKQLVCQGHAWSKRVVNARKEKKDQPRRPILKPFRGAQTIPPDCLQVPSWNRPTEWTWRGG